MTEEKHEFTLEKLGKHIVQLNRNLFDAATKLAVIINVLLKKGTVSTEELQAEHAEVNMRAAQAMAEAVAEGMSDGGGGETSTDGAGPTDPEGAVQQSPDRDNGTGTEN